MAYEVPVIRSVEGNTVRISHPTIPEEILTYLSSSISATGTSLSVEDNNGFAENDFVILGALGSDKTEIKRITAAVTQGTALTIAAATYDHPVDTEVQKVLWDQVEISGASTIGGSKTVITTMNLQADRSETVYVVSGTVYAYYFVRFYNSQSAAFSEYSDSAIATGFAKTVLRSVKDSALSMTGQKIGNEITDRFLNDEIFNCEQEVWSQKKRWSWAYTFEYDLGDTSEGLGSIALPSTIADPNSEKSILSVRIGTRSPLLYLTKEEWNRRRLNIKHTQVATSVGLADPTIVLDDSSDFDDSGSITIGDDEIDYTGNTRSTGTLTGVTGITSTHAVDVDVWQNADFGEPIGYTIFGGSLYFDKPVSSAYADMSVHLDFYCKPTTINSDSDTLNIPDYSVYHYYLAWKIRLKLSNGMPDQSSESFRSLFEERKRILMQQDRTGQRVKMKPRLNTIKYREGIQIVATNHTP